MLLRKVRISIMRVCDENVSIIQMVRGNTVTVAVFSLFGQSWFEVSVFLGPLNP